VSSDREEREEPRRNNEWAKLESSSLKVGRGAGTNVGPLKRWTQGGKKNPTARGRDEKATQKKRGEKQGRTRMTSINISTKKVDGTGAKEKLRKES